MTRAALCVVAAATLGILLVVGAGATGGMSRYIFITVDIPGLLAMALLSVALVLICRGAGAKLAYAGRLWPRTVPGAAMLALGTLAATALGTVVVHHGFALSMDEWLMRAQAEIFADGRLTGEIPSDLKSFARPMLHDFFDYDTGTGAFASEYRPGMSALLALFGVVGLGDYVSAIMAAGSVVMAWALARRIWPDEPGAAAVAALLIASSQQVLAAGLTSYAMAASLFFNLLWLWLFLADRWATHVAAALLGVFCASLHQIHVHICFAVPFLLTLLRPFRIGAVLLYGSVYLIGHLWILGWDPIATGAVSGGVGDTDVADGPAAAPDVIDGLIQRITTLMGLVEARDMLSVLANLVRFLAWQSLALLPLLLLLDRVALGSRIVLLLAGSIATSLLPYPLLMPDQGHGWGYRYLHVVIGNLALLGAAGWVAARRRSGATKGTRPGTADGRTLAGVVAVACLLTLGLMAPVRAIQIEGVVAPYVRGLAAVEAVENADVVVVDDALIWYGQDLVRPGPLAFEKPVAMSLGRLDEKTIRALCERFDVVYFGPADAAPLGIEAVPAGEPGHDPMRARWREVLAGPDCAPPRQ